MARLARAGERGLEIRCHGPRQAVPMDLYDVRGGRHGRHHSAGALVVRFARTDRRAAVDHCGDNGETARSAAAALKAVDNDEYG